MEITENQVFEAFGITPPEEQPAEQPAVAPEPETKQKEPETDMQPEESGDDAGDAETPDDAGAAEKPELTQEERRANAARRRQQETQAAIDAAVQAALAAERDKNKAEMDSFIARANMKNSLTGAPITTMEEYREWRAAFEAAQLQNDLKSGKLTPESLQQAISSTPAMQKVQELIARQDEAAKQRSLADAKAKVDADLAEIRKLDPEIKEVRDLLNMPTSKQFYEYVKKGLSYLDAYHLANRERLAASAAAAARQQAISNARSKDHLSPTGARGAGAVSVPADELALYREFLPGASEAEIQAHYNRYKNNENR